MKKSNKNVSAMLAKLATGVGGISQEQSKLNEGYEKIAAVLATWLAAGFALSASGDPEAARMLDDLAEEEQPRIGRLQEAMLLHGGTAVSDLMAAMFGIVPDSKLGQNPNL